MRRNLIPWTPQMSEHELLSKFHGNTKVLSGELPTDMCNGGKLLYFCALDNKFSGGLPGTYGSCLSLLRLRISPNQLQGSIPEGILGLPRVSIIDLGYNNFSGSLARSIGNAKNLSELLLQRNMISEYAYSTKATTKGEVYSFGVVLMELITGKKPVEEEFGENKILLYIGCPARWRLKKG